MLEMWWDLEIFVVFFKIVKNYYINEDILFKINSEK